MANHSMGRERRWWRGSRQIEFERCRERATTTFEQTQREMAGSTRRLDADTQWRRRGLMYGGSRAKEENQRAAFFGEQLQTAERG